MKKKGGGFQHVSRFKDKWPNLVEITSLEFDMFIIRYKVQTKE